MLATVAWLWIAALAVQAPAEAGVLENTGKPMVLPSPCTEDDIRALALTCPAELPCPVYLELAQMERVGDKIFVTGNLHTESATLSSVLLASPDGGKTWHEPHERIRSAALDQIQFLDFEAGWAAGQLMQALPRDPFLLLTTDGGKTWRRRPIWGEAKVGTVDHFWFDSRQHGLLWIDRASPGDGGRYEFYESMTGGESWMIREMSDRPVPRPERTGRPPNPNWRLRADAASRSYKIERDGDKWQTVASFLIGVGECKEPESAVPEPPPPPEAQPPAEAEPAPRAPPAPEAPKTPRKPPSLKRKPAPQ